jgi:hypothetical protein
VGCRGPLFLLRLIDLIEVGPSSPLAALVEVAPAYVVAG